LYQSTEGDRQLREQVHNRHITDQPFMDRSAECDWLDDEEGLVLSDLQDTVKNTRNGNFVDRDEIQQFEAPQLQYSPVLVQGLA
jgi:hypothetical protein